MTTEQQKKMIEEFQCPGCVCGSDIGCEKFDLRMRDLGGFACGEHVAGTGILGTRFDHPNDGNGLSIMLGLPSPFNTMTRDARKNHTLVLIGEEGGKEYLGCNDSQNIPVWKATHKGCTLVRIARPATCRYTTLVIDGEVDVPKPAITVDEEDRII